MMGFGKDDVNVHFETEVETKIAHELTQKLVNQQMEVINKMQKIVLMDAELPRISALTEAIEGLEILMVALKTGDFVIVAKP